MASTGKQVKNGKAFEFALAIQYSNYLQAHGIKNNVEPNSAYKNNEECYLQQTESERNRFDAAAYKTIDTIVKLEPVLMSPKNADDVLNITMATDAEGQDGDVRDVVFSREKSKWEIGFSAKNNHEAVKHSRLSHVADFGKSWLDVPCSDEYWETVRPIFSNLEELRKNGAKWSDIPDKSATVYLPILQAFRRELLKINTTNDGIPQRLIKYLIGKHPFYKIIKDDSHNLVVVKAFNLERLLNKTVNGNRPHYKTPNLKYPTRIVEFEMKSGSDTTLNMILDEGWEISFRIHNASSKVESSLKFDIQLIGNPPILFTQHLFQ